MNTTTIIGRLAHDPEIRFTTGGTSVATFRLAVPNPQDDDKPNWIPIKALGKTADAVAEYLSKGNQVAVTGRLESSEWDDNDGQRHWKLEVVARNVEFLNTKNKSTNDTDTREEATA